MSRWGTAEERFLARTEDGAVPAHRPELGPCLLYQGADAGGGYRSIWVDGKATLAHRYAYARAHGAIPDGMDIAHHCDNPPCVRESHLFSATTKENIADAWAKGRGRVPSRKGIPHTDEAKAKVSAAKAGIPWSEARRAAEPTIPRRWHHSEEAKRKISESKRRAS